MKSAGPLRPGTSIAIVGGGIIGLSAAWRLAQRGFAVTVYDKSALGGEASWAGAGMLAPGGEVEEESELASAAIASRRMYASYVSELEQASHTAIDYQECGALELAYSKEELDALERRAAFQATLGIASKAVSVTSIRAFWPRVQTTALTGARFYPDDAIVNPRQVVAALIATIRSLEVTLLENCPVSHLNVAADGVELVSGSGRSNYEAAVVAAGAWSGGIEIAGVPRTPPSEPVKGHLLGYLQPEQTCTTIIRSANIYLLQRANGVLLAGASVERVGFAREVNPDITAKLAAHAGAVLPHLGETTPTESWTGFRPGSDALHVGPWHSNRLYLAYGHFRNGILLAPWTADVLAEAIAANLETH
jgi:glycine oxidase